MVLTRKNNVNCDFKLLSYYNEIIYVSCSEIYNALKQDYICYIIDEKNKDNQEFKEKKWENIRAKSISKNKISDLFYDNISSFINNYNLCRLCYNKYKNLNELFDKNCLYLHRPSFLNKNSHINGIADGIIHKSLINDYLKINLESLEKDYLLIYLIDNDKSISYYHRIKCLTILYYLSKIYQQIENNFVLIISPNSHQIIYQDLNIINDIKSKITNIRKAKLIAKDFDLQNIYNRKYYPNMMEGKDDPSYTIKKKICEKIGDITEIWGCDDKHRQLCFKNKIYSWKDEKFSPEIIGIKDTYKAHILNSILKINRQDINSLDFKWMNIDNNFKEKWPIFNNISLNNMIYLDFEYLENGMIYLIGIYNNDEYKSFWADDLSDESEISLIQRFYYYLLTLPKDTLIWYWHADKNKWNSSCKKHFLFKEANSNDNWHDLCNLMRNGTITVYGAKTFCLKDVVNAFFNMNKIPFSYNDLECNDGKSSINFAKKYYSNYEEDLKFDLEKYNKMDCEAMKYIFEEIYNYLFSV